RPGPDDPWSAAMNARALVNRQRLVVPLMALIAVILAGCRNGAPEGDEEAAEPAAIVMAVSGVRVAVKPMHSELRLGGGKAARRHISWRAPAAGRVIGLNIQTGDRVRRGQVIAHLLSREVEAAENGLVVARQIDPAEAARLAQAVKRYANSAGVPVTIPED